MKKDYRKLYLSSERARKALLKRCEQWSQAHCDLQHKLNIALGRLQDLASGFYPSSFQNSWSHANKLMYSAAITLRELAKLRQREAP